MQLKAILIFYTSLMCTALFGQKKEAILNFILNNQQFLKKDSLYIYVTSTNVLLGNKLLAKHKINKNHSKLVIKGLKEPTYVNVELEQNGSSKIPIFNYFVLTNDTYILTFNGYNKINTVKGSDVQFLEENRHLLFELPEKIANNNSYKKIQIGRIAKFDTKDIGLSFYWKEYVNNIKKVIINNRNSFFCLSTLNNKKDKLPYDDLYSCFKEFSNTLKNTSIGKHLKEYLDNYNKFIKRQYPLQTNLLKDNDSISLVLDIIQEKKLTLLDFWASWCGPCIKDMNYLKSVYSNIDTSKIKIVSISIDDSVHFWKDAINKVNVPWQHFLDFEKNKLKDKLLVTYVPSNFLFNQEGELLKTNITIEDLLIFLKKEKLYLP